jgi:hypothetical protein
VEVETGPRPEWKEIADRSPTYKSYWALGNDTLKRNWESANGLSEIAQIAPSRSRDVLTELHDGASGDHLRANKPPQ